MNLKSDQECVSVKGRLSRALEFWKDIHAPQFIVDVIDFVYILPLLQIPTPFTARNNSSALEQFAFVENAIYDLPKRLILDLRHVNQFLYKKKLRCED